MDKALPDPLVGRTVANYEIVARLGGGGMGLVYAARDTRLGRRVALKFLPPQWSHDESARERFIREAQAASATDHPNICTIHDIGTTDDGQLFIVMAQYEGETLKKRLEGGPLGVDEAIDIAAQVAEGLAKAHAQGVIHRDIKPGNLMLTEDGVKILDFGLAKFADARFKLTLEGSTVGTIAYMSPEQVRGDEADARSDVWAAGAVLYEMLAGGAPFKGGYPEAIAHAIKHEPPAPLRAARPEVSEALEQLVFRALHKDPAVRFQSARDLTRALRRLQGRTLPLDLRTEPLPQVPTAVRRSTAVVGDVWRGAWRYSWIAVLIVIAALAIARFQAPAPLLDPATLPASALSAFEWAMHARTYLERYYAPENLDRAIEMYERSLERDPDYALAHAGLAEAYYQKNAAAPDTQWVRLSGESARKAVELNPDLAAAHLARGIALYRTPAAEEGLRALERARELDPRNARAAMWLAEYHVTNGDFKTAEALFVAALDIDPDDWMANQFFGRLLFRQARYEEAVARWERSRQLAPDNVLVHRNLGAAYHMLDRYEDAATALQRALEIIPNAGVYSNLGTVRFFQGRYEDAAATFEKAVEMNPTNFLYWGNLWDAHRWVPGQEANAKRAYGRAVELVRERIRSTPDDPELAGSLAVYLAKSGDKAGATEALSRLSTLPAPTAGSHFKALIAHEIIGNRDAALRALEEALRVGYALKEITNEPELTSLRKDRRYHTSIADLPRQ